MKPDIEKIIDGMIAHYKRNYRCDYVDENTFEDDKFLSMLEEYVEDALDDKTPPSEIIDDDFVSEAIYACQYGDTSDADDLERIGDDIAWREKAMQKCF